jgi:hypothetical protein
MTYTAVNQHACPHNFAAAKMTQLIQRDDVVYWYLIQ